MLVDDHFYPVVVNLYLVLGHYRRGRCLARWLCFDTLFFGRLLSWRLSWSRAMVYKVFSILIFKLIVVIIEKIRLDFILGVLIIMQFQKAKDSRLVSGLNPNRSIVPLTVALTRFIS
jgi:hypothetical protein